ncbi:DUF6428 family protein [Flavobacterium sp. WC2429]|uniref:DUF6428 family protein n=1 Tax=Flavobacterium sp. WC2429 TaxID=3234140 RepID=A0AB39WKX1_9FLAO
MKLSQVKNILKTVEAVNFNLPDGTTVPEHFHVTEVGLITKTFIDCGGTVRKENVINFQLWDANDFEHRLKPQKLLNIIELSEKILGIEDFQIEVEYQAQTIGKYDLGFNGNDFVLLNKQTACLAQDQCGIPTEKPKVRLSEMNNEPSCCTPGGSCC